jgi:hypothetical protein
LDGKIDDAIQIFTSNVPDRDNINDLFSSNCSFVGTDKLEYHLEHSIDDYDPGTGEYNREDITEVVTFEKELNKLFEEQYYISKRLLAKLEEVSTSSTKSLEIWKNTIVSCISDIAKCQSNIDGDSKLASYGSTCQRPLRALVKLIYKNYETYAPISSSIPQINKLRFDDHTDNPYDPSLKFSEACLSSVFEALENLEGCTINAMQESIANLSHFLIHAHAARTSKTINLSGSSEAIYVTLTRLITQAGIKLTEVPETVITINDSLFDKDKAYRANSRFRKNHPSKAATIDFHIRHNCGE